MGNCNRSEPGCHGCGSKLLDEVDQIGWCISNQATMDQHVQFVLNVLSDWQTVMVV